MSQVGVVHMDLGSKGGGEAVAMCLLEALQDDHDLTLLTLTEPDLDGLNAYYDTDVDADAVAVRQAGQLAPALNRRFGVKYYVLQNALLARYARRHADEFDLLVSTINELGLPAGSIEYVHFPFDWAVNLANRGDIFHPTIEDGSLYERLCRLVAGVSTADLEANTIFANSDWTADCFRAAYGIQPEVLYPPIDTAEFTDRPWARRENGFVCIGRLEESKRIVEIIGIIDALRDRGHDVHLHVVGPTYDERYGARLEALAATRPHVELEGELPRSALVELICAHRYGIHGKEHEHFGMAVAELAAGRAIPFVPATGGQRDIVREDARLLYETPTEAIEKIDAVLSDRALQRELRTVPGEIERRFGRDRFKARIQTAVAKAVGRPVPRPIPQADVQSAPLTAGED
jgi:glycosyltransferase involved in cell wall biosynthesis